MGNVIKYFCTLILALVSVAVPASAAPVVKAKLDSTVLLMGRTTTLTLSVDVEKNRKGGFPIFKSMPESGVVSLCGDSVEVRFPTQIDTVDAGNSLNITYKVPVQSFDSGYYRLPEFVYVAGNDTARSNRVALKVVPVVASKDTPINDYASVSDPEDSSIFDYLPDWLYDFWWLVLIILLALALGIYMLLRYKKTGAILPRKPEPTPYEAAISALHELKAKRLWEQGLEKEYFTELTEILRIYLYGRFGINAMEMTSRQILACLSRNSELKDKRTYFRKILDMADFVKFAKVRPLPEDNIESYDNALRFVEETKPVTVEEEESKDGKNPGGQKASKTSKSRKKGGAK